MARYAGQLDCQKTAGTSRVRRSRGMQLGEGMGREYGWMSRKGQRLSYPRYLLVRRTAPSPYQATVEPERRSVARQDLLHVRKMWAQAVAKRYARLQLGDDAVDPPAGLTQHLRNIGARKRLELEREGLTEELGSEPHVGRNDARNSVVACNQAPKIAAHDDRYRKRCRDAHVLQILNVDRGYAPQSGIGHVNRSGA